jgi:hypothetical protein
MHIIFGKDQLDLFKDKYTVLELDTFRVENQEETVTAYCVIENVPITEIAQLTMWEDLHRNLIENYQKRNWKFCEDALGHLQGRWNSEVDSFYANLSERIQQLKEIALPEDWQATIVKTAA